MASLIDVTDIRLILLYNNKDDLIIYNQGYPRDLGALLFQDYSIDENTGVLTLIDTLKQSKVSDLKLLISVKITALAILRLCKNGAARDGFLLNDVSLVSQDEIVSIQTEYKDFKLVCQGGYRKLSKAELLRGSRFSATEV